MHYCQSNTACVNLPGSHRCDCLPGFIRVDEYSCTGTSARKYITDSLLVHIVHLASHHTCSLKCDGSVGWWAIFYRCFNFCLICREYVYRQPSHFPFIPPMLWWPFSPFSMTPRMIQNEISMDELALQSSTGIHYRWSMNPNIIHTSLIFILLMYYFNNYLDNFQWNRLETLMFPRGSV